MKFYDETKALYMARDVSGVRQEAALLQTRSNTRSHKDEAPDNSILRPTAFVIKRLTRVEKIQQNRKRRPSHTVLT